jgi:hypothetical protein
MKLFMDAMRYFFFKLDICSDEYVPLLSAYQLYKYKMLLAYRPSCLVSITFVFSEA